MIDFTGMDRDVIIARGQYSIVRSRREDHLKELRTLCERQNGSVASVLRDIQVGHDVTAHFAELQAGMARMAEIVAEVVELQLQLGLIRPIAFPQ
jgi:hypothetical protein